jgi:serine/threonine protein kinase
MMEKNEKITQIDNIADKFNMMLINFEQIENPENKLGNDDYTGLLFGMPVVIRYRGINSEKLQNLISDKSKYAHPNLSINYGIILKNENNVEKVYIARDLVKGKNFFSISNLSLHNKLVILYKILCVLEFLHSFNFYYLFLAPKVIIVTNDINVKIVDLIKDDEEFFEKVKNNHLNDNSRFYHPDLLNNNNLLNNFDNTKKAELDIFSFGCLLFYSIFQELPWKNCNSKEEIIEMVTKKQTFLEEESQYSLSTDLDREMYKIINSCLNCDYKDGVKPLREKFETFPEIKKFIEEDYVDIDYEVGK